MGKTTTVKNHTLLLAGVLSLYVICCIIFQWKTFSISLPIQEYESRYSQSQYVLGENKKLVMGDGDIYTYAGIRYIQGEDPTKINFEHPPLLKYLFGLSYVATGKPNWILIPLFFIAGFAFWYLTGQITSSYRIRWLAVGLFLGHSTIYTTIFRTMLDFPMMTFLLLLTAMYCSLLSNPSLKKSLGWGFIAGLLISSQYPIPLLVSYVGLQAIALLLYKVSPKHVMFGLLTGAMTYLATYASFFLHGQTLFDFIKFEWWRLHWFMGKVDAPKGYLWQTIFTGSYRQWWGSKDLFTGAHHWNMFWPISIFLYVFSWFKSNIDYRHPLFVYKVWIVVALIGYSMGVAEDRFLIPLIPGFALFGASFLEKISKNKKPDNFFQDIIKWMAPALLVIYLGSTFYYWSSQSLAFYTDIGRDFLLIGELVQKKFVLIGARTSFGGVFHGPLWLYLNAPSYILSGGNPQAQTIFWTGLIIGFLASTYVLAKKVLGSYPALITVLLLSINCITISRWFTNPIGAFLLIPLFWYTMSEYLKHNRFKTLFVHFLTAGAIIQFEMMIGVPLTLLSIGLSLYQWRKTHTTSHWPALIGFGLMISSFILFDIRNGFLQTKSLLQGTIGTGYETHSFGDMFTFITQRFNAITRDGLGIFSNRFTSFNEFVIIVGVLLIKPVWKTIKKEKSFAILFYYFLGYFLLTLLFRDTLLNHYVWPLVSLPIIAFGYIIRDHNTKFVRFVVAVALFCGCILCQDQIKYANQMVGNVEDDWKFLSTATNKLYANKDPDIGVFIYAPDVYAYEQKYAAKYQAKIHAGTTETHFFEKRPVTYLLIAPPSGLNTEVTSENWKKTKLGLFRKPDVLLDLQAGYTIEKYILSEQEIASPVGFDVNDWIHFR